MKHVLLPAILGAGAMTLYGEKQNIAPVSAAIAGVAAGVGVALLYRRLHNQPWLPAQQTALSMALGALVLYDRWHDGLWPFTAPGKLAG